jgi:hypothetical protein
MPLVFGVIAVALFLVACTYQPDYPTKGVNGFWTDEPLLEQAFNEAVQRLTDAGVTAFAYVTLNVDKKGVPIKYSTPSAMVKQCNSKAKTNQGEYIAGCTSYSADDGHVDAIYIMEGAEYKHIVADLMHELIHVVLNLRQHNPKDGGLFSRVAGLELTQSDLDWICKFSDCIDPHLPAPRI